ncbi:hypothetical protein GIB67_008594 [Kingdonia uniflora]|uniref:Uncharacterized protein n=1 Tax=Kingdonia uniflora TaxID=39325 RepID=A0A7J7M4T2_9MAGN|nr:hypothetical protein GIB67_008594 [Kingdonia uniflora]
MELIYQICANTRMYSSKDELLEKDVELSNTRSHMGRLQFWRITLGGYKFMYIHGKVINLILNVRTFSFIYKRRGGELIRSSNFEKIILVECKRALLE